MKITIAPQGLPIRAGRVAVLRFFSSCSSDLTVVDILVRSLNLGVRAAILAALLGRSYIPR